MMAEDRLLFELSTEIAPPVVFGVDGHEYHILGFEHMGKEEEARVMALFAKHRRLSDRLGETPNQAKAEQIALVLRDTRMLLISTLTDLPREVAEKLPMSGQLTILRFISQEAGVEGGPDDEVPGGGDRSEEDDDLA